VHKIYLDKIDLNGHKDKIKDILDMLICDVKERNHELYEHIENELYEIVNGKKINKEKAEKWVEKMLPIGEYWSLDEINSTMKELGYNDDEIDFYIVANMMRNDYNDVTKDDEMLALKLAHDWLNDKDARDYKLYNYWKYVVKKD
jgi:hypothetical protein